MAGRRADRAELPAQGGRAAGAGSRRRGHAGADPPSLRASLRPGDRRDPQPSRPTDRHRPAVHRGTRPRGPQTRRHPSRPTTGPQQRTAQHRARRERARRVCAHDPPLDQHRPAARRADHPGATWRIRLTDEIRARFVPDVPDGYVPLDEAARRLAAPARPCCTRSNAASSTRSKSPTANEKA